MRKSGCSRQAARPGLTLLEVAFAGTMACIVVAAIFVVDGEVRRSYAVLRRELMLGTLYRDLMADEDRAIPAGLARATDQRPWPAAPITATADQLTLSGDAAPGRDLTVRVLRRADGAMITASSDHGGTWQPWLGLGDRGALQDVRFRYGGWQDPADVPPEGSRPYALDWRVSADMLRLHHRLGGSESIPFYAQAAWTPRATDWRWSAASRGGAPMPAPPAGILSPIAVWRDSLPATAGSGFDLFRLGHGSGGIGWLSWTGAPDTETLVANLQAPRSNLYANPDDPSGGDHLLTAGSWVPATPGHHAGAQAALDALCGREIVVVVWDQTRGRGSNSDVQALGFVRIRLDTSDIPGARATLLAWTDDQGRDLPLAEWPAPSATAATPTPSPTATPATPAPSATVATTSPVAPSPSATATASPTPTPDAAAVMPFALNLPAGTVTGADLGWQRVGSDFAWVSWDGDTGPARLAASLAWPGDVARYVDPADATDVSLDAGDEVIVVPLEAVDSTVASGVGALVGSTFVVPAYDQVDGRLLRASGFALVTLTREDLAHGRLQLRYQGPCGRDGTPR